MSDPLAPLTGDVAENNPDQAASPAKMVVNGSATFSSLMLMIRYAAVLLSGLGLASHVLTKGQLAYLQSNDFLATGAAFCTAAAVVWAVVSTKLQKIQLVAVALLHPHQVVVK